MSETLNKLNRISRLVEKGANIIMFLLIIVMILMLIAVTILMILSPDVLPSPPGAEEFTKDQILVVCANAVLSGVFLVIALYYVRSFFGSIHKNNTPFTDEGVRSLEILAIILVACAFIVPLGSALLSFATGFWPAQIAVFNPFLLFMALVMYFLSLIFKYGAALQKESDETL